MLTEFDAMDRIIARLTEISRLTAEVARLTAREKVLVKALKEIKECMGGDGAEGWDSPEDVWKIATKALLGPPAGIV